MDSYKLGEMEGRFADLIWQHEPVASGTLVKLCEEALDWKKSTTYTMLRRLCDRGMFENRGGTVTALLSREDFLGARGAEFLTETFGGSLPQFVAAFTRKNKLSPEEVRELQRLIAAHQEG